MHCIFNYLFEIYIQILLETFLLMPQNILLYSYLSCYSNVGSVTFITIVYFRGTLANGRITEKLVVIFKLKIKLFCCIYTLISLYFNNRKYIYWLNNFAVITCETTLAGRINSDQYHIDVGPTRTMLSGGLSCEKWPNKHESFSQCTC